MLTITVVGLFLFLALVISLAGYSYYARPGRFFRQLGHEAAAGTAGVAGRPAVQPSPLVRVFEGIGERLPVSPQDAAASRRDLMAAGFRSDTAVAVYYGVKIVVAVALLTAAWIWGDRVTNVPALRVVLVIAAGLAGYLSVNLFVNHMIAVRQEKLRFSLPDALDLMVVCVEAGLGLDQTLLTVSRELETTHPDLCGELSLVNLEMRAGMRRSDALRNLAERTGESEIRKLVAILIQTDRFGTSISEALRTHSDFMRRRRRLEAEERAGKVGVKLVFPIFFFLLPAMLLVAAGPGLLKLFKLLFPMAQNIGR